MHQLTNCNSIAELDLIRIRLVYRVQKRLSVLAPFVALIVVPSPSLLGA